MCIESSIKYEGYSQQNSFLKEYLENHWAASCTARVIRREKIISNHTNIEETIMPTTILQ